MKTKECRCCAGTGEVPDHAALGAEMREVRLRTALSQREVARRMGISAPYLCDLENGARNWRDELIESFRKACEP